MIETYIPMEDVLIKVKYHPDITKEEKAQFEEIVKGIYMTDKRKKKVFKPITKNQERNENSNGTSTSKD
jgi:DnaJ-class molecular chaperone